MVKNMSQKGVEKSNNQSLNSTMNETGTQESNHPNESTNNIHHPNINTFNFYTPIKKLKKRLSIPTTPKKKHRVKRYNLIIKGRNLLSDFESIL